MVVALVGESPMLAVHLVHTPDFLVGVGVLESQKLHHHVSHELRMGGLDVQVHVVLAQRFVNALVSQKLAQRVAMYCRIVHVANRLSIEACSSLVTEADQLIHHEVCCFHVLQPVC